MSTHHHLVLIVAALAIGLPAAPAQAKDIAKATVCGADGCRSITGRAQAPAGCNRCSAEELMMVRPGSAHPAQRVPFVRVVLGFGRRGGPVQHRERLLVAPALRLVARSDGRGGWSWSRPTPAALAVAARIVRDIRPYPAGSMPFERAAPAKPAEPAAPTSSGDAGSLPILAGAAILVAALGLGVVAVRRRRRLA